jgi:hypothetical protein
MADNNPNDELDFSAQIKSEIENGNLNIPGLEKEEEKKSEFESENTSLGQDMAIIISRRILKCLESKSKDRGCNVGEVIDVFKNATSNYGGNGSKIEWGFARVNQYLSYRSGHVGVGGEVTELAYSTGPCAVHMDAEVDVFEKSPTDQQIKAAQSDVKKFELSGFSFNNWEDLYIEDSEKYESHQLLKEYL